MTGNRYFCAVDYDDCDFFMTEPISYDEVDLHKCLTDAENTSSRRQCTVKVYRTDLETQETRLFAIYRKGFVLMKPLEN